MKARLLSTKAMRGWRLEGVPAYRTKGFVRCNNLPNNPTMFQTIDLFGDMTQSPCFFVAGTGVDAWDRFALDTWRQNFVDATSFTEFEANTKLANPPAAPVLQGMLRVVGGYEDGVILTQSKPENKLRFASHSEWVTQGMSYAPWGSEFEFYGGSIGEKRLNVSNYSYDPVFLKHPVAVDLAAGDRVFEAFYIALPQYVPAIDMNWRAGDGTILRTIRYDCATRQIQYPVRGDVTSCVSKLLGDPQLGSGVSYLRFDIESKFISAAMAVAPEIALVNADGSSPMGLSCEISVVGYSLTLNQPLGRLASPGTSDFNVLPDDSGQALGHVRLTRDITQASSLVLDGDPTFSVYKQSYMDYRVCSEIPAYTVTSGWRSGEKIRAGEKHYFIGGTEGVFAQNWAHDGSIEDNVATDPLGGTAGSRYYNDAPDGIKNICWHYCDGTKDANRDIVNSIYISSTSTSPTVAVLLYNQPGNRVVGAIFDTKTGAVLYSEGCSANSATSANGYIRIWISSRIGYRERWMPAFGVPCDMSKTSLMDKLMGKGNTDANRVSVVVWGAFAHAGTEPDPYIKSLWSPSTSTPLNVLKSFPGGQSAFVTSGLYPGEQVTYAANPGWFITRIPGTPLSPGDTKDYRILATAAFTTLISVAGQPGCRLQPNPAPDAIPYVGCTAAKGLSVTAKCVVLASGGPPTAAELLPEFSGVLATPVGVKATPIPDEPDTYRYEVRCVVPEMDGALYRQFGFTWRNLGTREFVTTLWNVVDKEGRFITTNGWVNDGSRMGVIIQTMFPVAELYSEWGGEPEAWVGAVGANGMPGGGGDA